MVGKEYCLDAQGFRDSRNFFQPKEIGIYAVDDNIAPSVYLIKPPYHWSSMSEANQNHNKWIEYNHIGIPWSSGNLAYNRVKETLNNALCRASVVYVRGEEKRKWLQSLIKPSVIEMVEVNLIDKKRRNILCNNHTIHANFNCPFYIPTVCAVQNALAMKDYLIDFYHRRSIHSVIEAIEEDKENEERDEVDIPEHVLLMYN